MSKDTASAEKKELEESVDVSAKVRKAPKRRLDKKTLLLSKLKRRALKHVWVVRIGLIAAAVAGLYLLFILITSFFSKTTIGFYAGLARDFMFTPQEKVESISGRTNILILGKGGKGHEAPDLTDTIIFSSIKQPKNVGLGNSEFAPGIELISLPRDIWIPELRAKLNSAYYWGNQKQQPDGGLILSKATVEQIVGAHVHYVVVIDFSGFKDIVDTLGGVEVEVEHSFVDKKYPIAGREDDDCGGSDSEYLCRYETIEFERGKQIMDGETALKFARSRNAEGDEGTDFARAARQEKVLYAIKNKALSREVITNPKKVLDLIEVVQASVETDIDPEASAVLARRIFEARDNITTNVLPEDLLENPPISSRYDNLYVFVPKTDTNTEVGHEWDKVHDWVECVLANESCD